MTKQVAAAFTIAATILLSACGGGSAGGESPPPTNCVPAPPIGPPFVRLDWKSPGDGWLLRDTNTNLTWLHLSQTLNRSVNDLMGQFFGNTNILPLVGEFSNFRYATTPEVAQLYTDA